MDNDLFLQLEDWNLSRETLKEYTELIGLLTGLPNVTYAIVESFQEEVRHELELWQKLAPHFKNRDDAVTAYCAAEKNWRRAI